MCVLTWLSKSVSAFDALSPQLCPSYPSEVIVPDAVTEEILQKVSKYRYLNRFPILCYYHKKSSAPLLLSSQPMMGSTQKRCSEDSQLLNSTLPAGTKGFVVDTRSQAQTQQQTLKGKTEVQTMCVCVYMCIYGLMYSVSMYVHILVWVNSSLASLTLPSF